MYCHYKAREEQDTSRMLAAILKQLVQARLSLVDPVERLHKQHADRGTRPSPDDVFSALQDVLAHYSTVYIVVDALDECLDNNSTGRQFLAKIHHLQVGRDVRLMVTSRFVPEIVDWFKGGLKLEVQASEEDVKRFVTGQICRLPKCIQHDSALQEVVQKKIVEAVDGMFLLARLHTDSLLDKRTAKDVKSTLAKLSKGSAALDYAYKEAIQRIEGQLSGDYKLAKRVLSWITHAKRPLTTTEICCALAVESDEADLDPENVPDVEGLLSVCAGLVVVDQESAVIRLVHYTTQEYFARILDAWNPGAQLHMASTCLTYLSFRIFKTGSCSSDEEFEERLRRSQFLDYAAKHWGEHALTAEGDICELACSFLSCKELVSCAAQVLLRPEHTYQGYSQKYPKDSMGLQLISFYGLAIVSEALLLLNNGADASRHDSHGKSVLHYATNSVDCNLSLIDLLLSRGAPANTTDINNMTPLLYCVKHGHKSIIELLLDNGVSIDACVYRKPWSWNIVKTDTFYQSSVSESKPDVSGASADLTALHFAALTGNPFITKSLLERGADPNALSKYNESPMHLTLRKTQHGPGYNDDWTDPNFRIESMWDFMDFEEDEIDSVSAKVTMYREGVLDALLADARTSLTIRDCQHNYPLHCFEYKELGSVSIIRKLVSRRANPLERNLKQQNALHLASRAGDHDQTC